MDTEIIGRIAALLIGAIAAGFTAFKTAMDVSQLKRSHLRDEYKFAREFFADLERNDSMHPFLKQKGLQAIAGTTDLSPEEIHYLLTLKESTQAIRNYSLGKKYLRHLPGTGNLQIDFKKKYSDKNWRIAIKSGYLALYGIFVFLAGSPLLLPWVLSKSSSVSLGVFLLTILLFGPYAYFSLRAGVKVSQAERLVENQESHTQLIIVPADKRVIARTVA
jgi:hypothetical protein